MLGCRIPVPCEMTKRDQFKAQAQRAGRSLWSPLRSPFIVLVGVVLLVTGLAFTQSLLPWVGVPTSLVGAAIICYGLWWALVGRRQDLTCPLCGERAKVIKGKWDYLFRCPRCGRTAHTGVGAVRWEDGSP